MLTGRRTHILRRSLDLREYVSLDCSSHAGYLYYISVVSHGMAALSIFFSPSSRLQRGENIYGRISIALTLGRRY